jgi:hypothetical protein
MILRWSPFKIVSVSAVLYPRWPPLLKIEISSNGQNCIFSNGSHLGYRTALTDTILKGDHLRIISAKFELWTFTDFDRLWNKKKGGMKLKKNLLLWNYWANLNQTLLRWSLGGPLSKLCPSAPSCIQGGHHY